MNEWVLCIPVARHQVFAIGKGPLCLGRAAVCRDHVRDAGVLLSHTLCPKLLSELCEVVGFRVLAQGY